MDYPREVLNRLKWTEGMALNDVVVWYVHRGAPRDVMRITGDKIMNLGRSFFDTNEATIPYHRILRIDHRGRTLFEKDDRAKILK